MDESLFEWGPDKEATNLAKHGIDFVDASSVFEDPHYLEEESTRPGDSEERLKGIGTAWARCTP